MDMEKENRPQETGTPNPAQGGNKTPPAAPEAKKEKAKAESAAPEKKEAPKEKKAPEEEKKPKKEKEPKAPKAKKEEETLPPPPPPTPEELWMDRRSDIRRKWTHRRRVRARHRRIRRFFFGLFVFLLGVVVAYGAVGAAAYFALGGMTIDNLQRFGMAKEADKYLTRNGEVDLTSLTLLEIYSELKQIKARKSDYTLAKIQARYGIVLPDEIQRLMPMDLFTVPLDQLASSNAPKVIGENLTVGYLFTLASPSGIDSRVIEVISPRPIALLTNAEFGQLFHGVRLGYLTSVDFDENGAVRYQTPAAPTLQELMAPIDVGDLMQALKENRDLLEVIVDAIGDEPAGTFISGITEGAIIDSAVAGKTVADLFPVNAETGRREFSLSVMTEDLQLGTAMGYTKADGVWYSIYVDNDTDVDDVRVGRMSAALANISLFDAVNNNLSLSSTFADTYLGDIQEGYTRGAAITKIVDDAEVTVGYEWQKGGEDVNRVEKALANVGLFDLLDGTLKWDNVFDDVLLGDAAGYVRGEVTKAADPADPSSRDEYAFTKAGATPDAPRVAVKGAMLSVSNIPLADFLTGNADFETTVKDLTIADVMEYTKVGDDYYSVYSDDDDDTNDVKVTGILAAFAGKKVSEINEHIADEVTIADALHYTKVGDVYYSTYSDDGDDTNDVKAKGVLAAIADKTIGELNASVFDNLYIADVMGYAKVGDDYYSEYTDDGDDTNDVKVTGVLAAFAGKKVSEINEHIADDVTIADALHYTKVGDVYYSAYSDDGDDTNDVKVTGVLAAIADKTIGELNGGVIDNLYLADVMGYTKVGDDYYSDEGKVTGVLAAFAGKKVSEIDGHIADEVTIADALHYTKVGDVYYSVYSDDGNDENDVKAKGVLAAIADKTIGELNESVIDNLYIADVMGYTKVGDDYYSVYTDDGDDANDVKVTGILAAFAGKKVNQIDEHIADDVLIADVLHYTEKDGVYYSVYSDDGDPTNDKKVKGVLAAIADKTLAGLNESVVNNLYIGAVVGYIPFDDDEDGVRDGWKDDNGTVVTGLMAKLADSLIGELSEPDVLLARMREVTLAQAVGFERHDGKYWSHWDNEDPTQCVMVTGVLAQLADRPVNEINSTVIDGLYLGDALGYEKTGGVWYKNGVPADGALAKLADKTLAEINSDAVSDITVGDALSYTFVDTDDDEVPDTWKDKNGVTVTGVQYVMASLTIGSLGDKDVVLEKWNQLTLGESLGYEKVGDEWQKSGVPADGLIGALAATPLGQIETEVNNVAIGTMLKYTKVDGVWYEKYDPDNLTDPAHTKKVSAVIGAIADANLTTFGNTINNLTVSDLYPERDSGVLALVDGNAKITELDTAVQTALTNATMGDLFDKGIVTASGDLTQLNKISTEWRDLTLNAFFDALLQKLTMIP